VPFFIPPTLLIILERARLQPKKGPAKTALELSLIFLQLYCAVPLALGVFPRMGSISAADLEPQFQSIKAKDGSLVTEFAFNKGL